MHYYYKLRFSRAEVNLKEFKRPYIKSFNQPDSSTLRVKRFWAFLQNHFSVCASALDILEYINKHIIHLYFIILEKHLYVYLLSLMIEF